MTARFVEALAPFTAQQVLVLGPGRACPIDGLLAALPGAHFTLVDRDSRAAPYYAAFGFSRVRCITGDVRETALYADRRYELAVCRHPDIDKHQSGWAAAFEAVGMALSQGAGLVLSTYTLGEQRAVTDALAGAPFKIRSELKPGVPVALSGADRYILWYVRDKGA